MSTSTSNRTTRLVAYQALIDGFTKYASLIATLLLGGTQVKNADIVARLEALIASGSAVGPARATYRGTVKSERDLLAANRQFLGDVTQSLRSAFGGQPEVLAAFGLAPFQRATPSTETKVAALAKAKATRAARGTKGSRQAAQIRGDVAGVVVTPLVQPAPVPQPAATAPAQPAATAPAATATGATPPRTA